MNEALTDTSGMRLVPLTEGGLELELSEMESIALRTLLEANGIDVVLQGASQMPNLPYELLVPENQLEEAVRVIRESQQSGAQAVDAEAGAAG